MYALEGGHGCSEVVTVADFLVSDVLTQDLELWWCVCRVGGVWHGRGRLWAQEDVGGTWFLVTLSLTLTFHLSAVPLVGCCVWVERKGPVCSAPASGKGNQGSVWAHLRGACTCSLIIGVYLL